MVERRAHVCLNVAYTLQDEGIPTDLELLKSWSRDADNVPLSDGELDGFVQSAATALTHWRFVAKAPGKRPTPTRTSATLVFLGNKDLSNADVAANCKVSDLGAYQNRNSDDERRRTERQIMQRTELQQQQDRRAAQMAELLRRAQSSD